LKNALRVHMSANETMGIKSSRMPLSQSQLWIVRGMENKGAKPALDVFITQNAYVRMCAHAGSDLDNEVGGWMAGKHCQDSISGESFIVIDTILLAQYTNQGPAHLTFTGDSQVEMLNTLETSYPNKVLVGWYHTHPRMGVFLSQWDIWLHQNFFPEPWQVALVIEPFSSIGGVFIRQEDGSLEPQCYYGFYEIRSNPDRSVVFWQNLQKYEEQKKEKEPHE